MKIIGIKYCGGCNPLIDRPGLVREIEKLLHPGLRLITDMASAPWEIGILICGCPTACADRPEIGDISKRWIRVGGPIVGLDSMEEDKMAAAIVERIHLLQTKR
jgi:3-hydroxyacyl-[acyl-carrier-protein] dehydratase